MTRKLSDELKFIDAKLDDLRFAGLDQNPHGIRDRLGSLIPKAEKMERALSCERHENGSRKWADDGTLLTETGSRSVFDDVDE